MILKHEVFKANFYDQTKASIFKISWIFFLVSGWYDDDHAINKTPSLIKLTKKSPVQSVWPISFYPQIASDDFHTGLV